MLFALMFDEKKTKTKALRHNCDTAKHVYKDGKFLKIKLLNLIVLEIVQVSYVLYSTSIGSRSDSLLILLVVGFDDPCYCQENFVQNTKTPYWFCHYKSFAFGDKLFEILRRSLTPWLTSHIGVLEKN